MKTYFSHAMQTGDREMAGENRTLSHTPEGKGDGDKKRGTQWTGSQKCQRRTRYEVSAWRRVTLERRVWCWIAWIEQFLWINAQYFLTINDKAKKTEHLSDLLAGSSLENFLTFIFSIATKENQEVWHLLFSPEHTIISILTGRHCGFYKMIKTDKYPVLLTRLGVSLRNHAYLIEVEQECPVWPVFQLQVTFFTLKRKHQE